MANDRNRYKLSKGDAVRIIPGMSKGFNPLATVLWIDGEYVYLDCVDFKGEAFIVERYGCELWSMVDGQPGKDI